LVKVGKIELEAKLAVVSSEPGRIADEISQVPVLGGFQLVPRETTLLRDCYVDMPDRRLEARRLNLRIRRKGGLDLVTVKGPDRITGRSLERLEDEAVWSAETLAAALERLTSLGAEVPTAASAAGLPADPISALEALGFEVIHQRATERRPRLVFDARDMETALAELAVDATLFMMGGRTIRHYELEIEVVEGEEPGILNGICQDLVSRWPCLIHWPYSKIATGLALERLLTQGGLTLTESDPSGLEPSAYGRIGRLLGQPGSE
jgi:inorganic triphosphatase YgiF